MANIIKLTPSRSITLWLFLTYGLFIVQYARLYPDFLEVIRPFALMTFALIGFIFFSQKKDMLLLKYREMWIIYATIGWMIVSSSTCLNYGQGFMTSRSVMMFLPFMLSVVHLTMNVEKLKVLVNVIIFTAALNVVHGYLFFDGAHRNTYFNIGAFLTDPNDYSLYMNMMLPFCYFMFLQEIKWNYKKIIYFMLSVSIVIMTILSYSRGGMVGLVATGFCILCFSPNKKVTFSAASIALICILAFSSNSWKDSMETMTDTEDETANNRLDAWNASTEIFMDYPLLGIGPMNTSFYTNRYIEKNAKQKQWGHIAHSIWFTALAEGGIGGIILLLSLVYVNLNNAWRLIRVKPIMPETRYLKYFGFACFSSMIAYLTSGSFLTVNYYPHIWYLTAFIVAGIKLLNLETQRSIRK